MRPGGSALYTGSLWRLRLWSGLAPRLFPTVFLVAIRGQDLACRKVLREWSQRSGRFVARNRVSECALPGVTLQIPARRFWRRRFANLRTRASTALASTRLLAGPASTRGCCTITSAIKSSCFRPLWRELYSTIRAKQGSLQVHDLKPEQAMRKLIAAYGRNLDGAPGFLRRSQQRKSPPCAAREAIEADHPDV